MLKQHGNLSTCSTTVNMRSRYLVPIGLETRSQYIKEFGPQRKVDGDAPEWSSRGEQHFVLYFFFFFFFLKKGIFHAFQLLAIGRETALP
jgi:hypothetical protein